jgi:O-antigen ligase
MKKLSLANTVRIPSAILLIALEFTSLFPFLAEGGKTPVTNERSRYTLYFAAYGICALIVALDFKSAKRFLEKPLVLWAFAALMLFTWGMLVRMFNAPAGMNDYYFFRVFGLQINAIGFLLCCTMIFDDLAVLQVTKRAVVVATLVGVVLNIYDFMFPGFFSYNLGRAAGLYVNPNFSGISLALGCVIGLSAIRRPWRQEAFVLVSFIGVLVTFSREAILVFGCVLVGGNLAGQLRLRRLAVAGGIGVALFVAFNMGNSLLSEKIASSDQWSRLTSHSLDDSAGGRANLAKEALDVFEEAPLLGQGFGTNVYLDNELGSHNFYLSLLADHGIVGIFLIPTLLLSIGRKSWDFYAFAAAFLVFCLFSHNVFDQAAVLISLAIEAVEAHPWHATIYDPKLTLLLYGRT